MAVGLTKKQTQVLDRMKQFEKTSPWILRVSQQKKYTGPLVTICERTVSSKGNPCLVEHGFMHNGKLRFCKDVIRMIVSHVTNDNGEPLELHALIDDKLEYRGYIPLDDAAGAKLALLFKLQATIPDMERVELMAWRIERFTREESLYWLSKVTVPTYGEKGIAWAKTGLRAMLGGRSEDKEDIQLILNTIRK